MTTNKNITIHSYICTGVCSYNSSSLLSCCSCTFRQIKLCIQNVMYINGHAGNKICTISTCGGLPGKFLKSSCINLGVPHMCVTLFHLK